MKPIKNLLLFLFLLFLNVSIAQKNIKNSFIIPQGYERVNPNNYHKWLINQPLIFDSPVKIYQGDIVYGLNDIYIAKFDYSIGVKNLHQCADAAMYFNATYLYETNQWDRINYHFDETYSFPFKRYVWRTHTNDKTALKKYLEKVWAGAGSLSLDKFDTKPVMLKEAIAGDLIIEGGSPGHVITIVDVIVNKTTGVKKYMLAQSYMPAQEQYILLNEEDPKTVWFEFKEGEDIETPGWLFSSNSIKRFKNN